MPRFAACTVMLPDLTPEDAVVALADIGYDGVEWRVAATPPALRDHPPSYWGNNRCTLAPSAAEMAWGRALAADRALAIPNLGCYLEADEAAGVAAIELATAAGSPAVRVLSEALSPAQGSLKFLLDRARAHLEALVPHARDAGVRLLVEIHFGTIVPSASLVRRLVDGFDPACVGVIHDAGNMVFEGFEPYALGLEVLGPYLAHVHAKNASYLRLDGDVDGAGTPAWVPTFSPIDDGLVRWDTLFEALAAVGYDGWISVEDFSGANRPSADVLREDLAFLQSALARAYT